MGKDPEGTESVEDAHEITESGFPKVSSIAYAKNILGVEPSATVEEVNEAYTNGYINNNPYDFYKDALIRDTHTLFLSTLSTFFQLKLRRGSKCYVTLKVNSVFYTIQI